MASQSLHPESFIQHHTGFGDVAYYKTSHFDEASKEFDYVPEYVSCITPGNELIVQVAPLALRRVRWSKATQAITQPEVLTVNGVVSLNKYVKMLGKGQAPPTLNLPRHPAVPVLPSGLVDVPAILKMNRRIAARATRVKIEPSRNCCDCPQELDADLETQEELFIHTLRRHDTSETEDY